MLFLNNETKPFNDVAFRQALNMVVDRRDISETAGYGVWPADHERHRPAAAVGRRLHLRRLRRARSSRSTSTAPRRCSTDAGYTWDGDALVDPDGEKVSFTLTNPTGWTDYLDALGIIAEAAAAARRRGRRSRPIVPDTWFNDIIPFGNFQASLHWTDGGATPWNMYSNIMDGASYVPLGETATWNFGRYQNDEVTAGARRLTRPAPPTRPRTPPSTSSSRHFVEDVPGIVDLVPPGRRAVLDGELRGLARRTRTPTRTRSPRVRRPR